MITVDWADFKSYYDATVGVLHYIDSTNHYKCYSHNGDFSIFCTVNKDGGADVTDFEANYKDEGNISLNDTSGRPLTRVAATTSGWHFEALNVAVETSVLNSNCSEDVGGTEIPVSTLKFYDDQDAELTIQDDIDTDCVKTVMTIQIPMDVDLIGGMVYQNAKPTSSVRMWVVVAQGLPGGDKRMVTDLDLYHVPEIIYDGKAALRVIHDPVYNSNTFTCTFKHSVGFKHKLMIAFEYFVA